MISTTPPSSLLTLPPELRLQIYTHLFSDLRTNIQIFQSRVHNVHTKTRTCSPLPLLLTCRIISTELQELLYRLCSFTLQLHNQHSVLIGQQRLLPSGFRDFGRAWNLPFTSIMCNFLSKMRRVELEVWMLGGNCEEMVKQVEGLKKVIGELSKCRIVVKVRPKWLKEFFREDTSGKDEEMEELLESLGGFKEGADAEVEAEIWPMVQMGEHEGTYGF